MPLKNIFDLRSTQEEAPIQEGDAILIIRPGEDVKSMTFGVDQEKVDSLRSKDPNMMSDEELDLLEQGQKLFLLSMAANNDAIMQFLAKVSLKPGETDLDKLSRVATVH